MSPEWELRILFSLLFISVIMNFLLTNTIMIFAFVKVILGLASVKHEQVATMYMTIPNWHWNVQHASMISIFPMQIQIGLQGQKAVLGAFCFSAIRFEEFVSQITVTVDSVFKNQWLYYILCCLAPLNVWSILSLCKNNSNYFHVVIKTNIL